MSQQDFADDYLPDWNTDRDRMLSQDQFGGSNRRGNDNGNLFDPGNSQSQGMNFSQVLCSITARFAFTCKSLE